MSVKKPIPSVREISTSIKEKRKKARKLFIRRVVFAIVVISSLTLTSLGLYALDQSSYLRIETIIISHVRLSDEDKVWQELPFQVNDRLWLYHPFWTTIPVSDDAIEDITFVANRRSMIIEVKEFKPLALTSTHILLSNGVYYPITPRNSAYIAHLPTVEGFSESELSVKLARALIELEDFVLNLMSGIKQTPLSYDEAMMVITLDNGLNVHSDLRSLVLLNQLPLFIDLISETNNCLYLDSVTSTARAAPCP